MIVNKPVMKEWIAALRSGEYQQGKRQLAMSGGRTVNYCCLGVLCELAVEHGVTEKYVAASYDGISAGITFDGMNSMPPETVREWIGMDSWVVRMDVDLFGPVVESLPMLNDDLDYSFDAIANLLEETYLTAA